MTAKIFEIVSKEQVSQLKETGFVIVHREVQPFMISAFHARNYIECVSFKDGYNRMVAASIIHQNKDNREPYPPPSRLIKENSSVEIKQCCHCEHSSIHKDLFGQRDCEHPKVIKHIDTVEESYTTTGPCIKARARGFLGIGRGKCGPEAKLYEVKKFKDDPQPPKGK